MPARVGYELFSFKAFIDGHWKIVWMPKPLGTGEWELFDLSEDPAEVRDLSAEQPEKLEEMVALWNQYKDENGVLDIVPEAAKGALLVADHENNRIQRFDPTGTLLGLWGGSPDSHGPLSLPSDVAVAPDGTVVVADTGHHRIGRFTSDGLEIGGWGGEGTGHGLFRDLSAVAVAPDGIVYGLDADHDRVQVFGPAFSQTWRAELYANPWLTEAPKVISDTTSIDFDWGMRPPHPDIGAGPFSARFERHLRAAGEYTFTVEATGGVRLWSGGRLLVDRWSGARVTETVTHTAALGGDRVRLEYRGAEGPSAVKLSWRVDGVFLPVCSRTTD